MLKKRWCPGSWFGCGRIARFEHEIFGISSTRAITENSLEKQQRHGMRTDVRVVERLYEAENKQEHEG